MEPQRIYIKLFFVLAVCFAFSIGFSEILTAADLEHDCTEEECVSCLQIEAAKIFLKNLKQISVILFFAVPAAFMLQPSQQNGEFNVRFLSPVALKVRFNT